MSARWRAAGLTLLFFVSLLFGAVVADPFGAYRSVCEAWLFSRGARVEYFQGPDGTRLRVLVLGRLSADRPVLLLHGLGADATYWTSTALALTRRGFTVLLLDGAGSGGSAAPRSPEGFGVPARVAAVEGLMRAFGLEKVDLVGHSLGGWTAAVFAIQKPYRVGRLVLVDPGGFTPIALEEVEKEKARLSPHDRAGGAALLDILFHRPPFPILGFVQDSFARTFGGRTPERSVAALRPEDMLLSREGSLPRGTTLIWGEEETIFPIADGRAAAARIPGARLLVLTGVGHDGPLEAPEVFEKALLSALGAE